MNKGTTNETAAISDCQQSSNPRLI